MQLAKSLSNNCPFANQSSVTCMLVFPPNDSPCAFLVTPKQIVIRNYNLETSGTSNISVPGCQGILGSGNFFPLFFPAATVMLEKLGFIVWTIYIFIAIPLCSVYLSGDHNNEAFFKFLTWSGRESDEGELINSFCYWRVLSSSCVT